MTSWTASRRSRSTRWLVLGIAWLVIAIIVVTTDVNGMASTALVGALFALWVVLLFEYLVRLVVSPDARGYVKRRWVEPATVAACPRCKAGA